MNKASLIQTAITKEVAICENCHWTATLLASISMIKCPLCCNEISTIPLSIDESYTVNFDGKAGLDISFSLKTRNKG